MDFDVGNVFARHHVDDGRGDLVDEPRYRQNATDDSTKTDEKLPQRDSIFANIHFEAVDFVFEIDSRNSVGAGVVVDNQITFRHRILV